MNTKHILLSLVTGIVLTGSLAFAAQGNDQLRAKSRAKVAKPTTATTTTVRGSGGTVHTPSQAATVGTSDRVRTRNRVVSTTGSSRTFRTGNRVVNRNYPYRSYSYRTYSSGYPYYGYGYPYSSYGYGYPSYGLGVTFGAPYGYSNYPYGYGDYPSNYSYGYYSSNRAGYGNGSIVAAVQSRLARAGYYRGPIDGVMGRGTSYAIRAYESRHGLRVDGVISGQLLRNMGLRY